MAFIPVPNVAKVFWDFTGPDDVRLGWSTNFLFTPGSPSVTDLSDLGEVLIAQFDANLQPAMTAGYTLTRLQMRVLTTEDDVTLDYTTGLPLTGTNAGNSLPANVALSIKLGSVFAGRSRRGRLYWMGMSETNVSGNFVEESYADNVVDQLEALRAAVASLTDWRWCIVSYFSGGAPRAAGQVTTITSVTLVDYLVDTQRRRLS